ncbi:putative ABC transport system permease protein [Reichenbachiella faecimaris]|uniref:Putative ABC transport system permease protein n=1 Tax=Reichenbachiella faecimaris TaxID=692418 RepID=A0A1W2GEF1_REIFA|nr:ABC transporter permease [Reichenbachiella faecimaris]SMD34718.1 putative ABC transport system permease protein [Reichenbachiella faecimaris]
MLKNYITVAIRNIQNSPVYSTINVIGLTIGIVSSLLLYLYIDFERSYDSFHSNRANIYRVSTKANVQDTEFHIPQAPSLIGSTLKNEFGAVENFVRVTGEDEILIAVGEDYFYEKNILKADSSFFDVFDFELLEGDRSTCLSEPNTLVVSKTLAEKWFPNTSAMGKSVKTDGEDTKIITGIMADPKINSSIRAHGLLSYGTNTPGQDSWGNLNDQIFVVLPAGTKPTTILPVLTQIYEKYMAPIFDQFSASAEFSLQPLEEIHLYSNFDMDLESEGDISYLYIFSAIGFFMLLIACINYMNMATARSVSRSKEVGIRKAMGSYKSQLMGQFITESVVIAFIALIISLILTFFLIPYFNELTSLDIDQNFISNPKMLIVLVAIILFVGLVGGSYPAFYLSRFKAAEVLKGKSQKSRGNESLRKALVVAQFAISLGMVASTWIVFDQLSYLRNKELGFNQEQVVMVTLEGQQIKNKLKVLSSKLLQNPNVESVGSGFGVPGSNSMSMSGIKVESANGTMIEKIFQNITADNQFFPTFEIPIIEGRNFLPEVGNDTAASVIVNEEMVKEMGWDNPIGKKFHRFLNDDLDIQEFTVVGVVRNFHLISLQEPIAPLLIYNGINNGQMIVRLKAENIANTMSEVEQVFKSVVTNRPFEYAFVNQGFQKQYEADEKRGDIFAIFSILTIAIACLGLFGLASYTAEARRKEIGIRKVVGANVLTIIIMMSKDFLKLIIISMSVAFPISYYFMDQWLQNFAYSMELSWTSFALSALFTLVIAFVTVLYHSLKSAIANPSTAIRDN